MIVIAIVLAAAGLAAFAVLVVGIQVAEHRMGLPGPASGRADAFARRVLRAHVGQPVVRSQRTTAARRGQGRGDAA